MTAISLLEDVYNNGEALCEALREEDYERFSELARARGTLIEQLGNADRSKKDTPEWKQWSDRLVEQDEVMQQLVKEREQALAEKLNVMGRYQGARQSYAGEAIRPSILNPDVRG